MRSTVAGLVAGLLAGVLAAVAMMQGLFLGGVPAVPLALWERTLRLLPMELFSVLIVRLKFAAKPLAFWGMLGVLVLLAGLLGLAVARPAWRGRPLRRAAVAFLAAAAVLLAVALGPAADALTARLGAQGLSPAPGEAARRVALAVAGYAGLYALGLLLLLRLFEGRPEPRAARPAPPRSEVTRREVLHRSLVLGTAALAGTALVRLLAALGEGARVAAQTLFDRIRGLPPEVTPNDQFYVVSKNPPGFDPDVDASRWRLEVTGLVGKPLRLTLEELKALPAVRQVQTLECISNEVGGDLISNAWWRGVRLRDVLALAGGVSPKAVKLAFTCADGYTESLPVVDALHPDTLLVYEMNGEVLPRAHGFPLRLLVPGLFGMKNPKWITKIEAVDYDFQGYWERSGWSDEAVVKTMSKFTTPTGRASATVGEEVALGGVAYAGDRGIRAVEVSVDDGKTWLPAQVKPPLGKYTWVLWAALWKPTAPGQYTLKVRARDGVGVLQTARVSPPLPDGATGYHTIRLTVRR